MAEPPVLASVEAKIIKLHFGFQSARPWRILSKEAGSTLCVPWKKMSGCCATF
jgi:hypothetical protein